MSLRIPPEHIALLKGWLELPAEEVAKFSSALEKAPPRFNAYELAKSIIPDCDLAPGLVFAIVQVLISVYRTGEPEKPFESFLDREVRPALKHAKTFSDGNEEQEWGRLRSFFLHALSLEGTVGTTAKAGSVLTEHERIFDGLRIMTDFRPIFHVDVSEKPNAGLIVHMVKITHRDKHDRKFDSYYALDSNDIAKIRSALDRAAEKEKALRKTMEDAGISVLDVQSSY
jgi:hypothetical protein